MVLERHLECLKNLVERTGAPLIDAQMPQKVLSLTSFAHDFECALPQCAKKSDTEKWYAFTMHLHEVQLKLKGTRRPAIQ